MTSLTITAKVGPGLQATALEFDNVKSVKYEYTVNETHSGVIEVVYVKDNTNYTQYFDFDGVVTVTHVIAGANTTITIA